MTATLPAGLARFWVDDRGLSVFLALLLVLIFVLLSGSVLAGLVYRFLAEKLRLRAPTNKKGPNAP